MSGFETRDTESAGGVLYRRAGDRLDVALILVGKQRPRWMLPKGTLNTNETPEQAALREVREETGLEGRMVAPLERIEYWFASKQGPKPVRFHKFVHFFLMEYVSGSVDDHDHEVEEARWVEINEAVDLLAFENEKSQVRQAQERLRQP